MSKVITVPAQFTVAQGDKPERKIKNPWAGSVTICERLTLPQVELIETGLEPVLDGKYKSVFYTTLDKPKLPAILACVEKWELSDFPDPVTVDNFPMHNRGASHQLISIIFDAIKDVYIGELEIPNE